MSRVILFQVRGILSQDFGFGVYFFGFFYACVFVEWEVYMKVCICVYLEFFLFLQIMFQVFGILEFFVKRVLSLFLRIVQVFF